MPVTTSAVALPRTLVPQRSRLLDAVFVLGAAGLIALCAQISIPLPFTPVPITGQTFAVLLAGAALGTVRGSAGAGVYVLLGIAGAPVYAEHAHGWSIVTGASGGYLVAYPLAAALVGYLAERGWDRSFSSAVGAMLTGNVVIYAIGLPWLAVVLHTNLDKTLLYGLYPFVVGDLLKLYLAGAVLPAAWRLVRGGRI
jgi:biotin transport system substrate-specific component